MTPDQLPAGLPMDDKIEAWVQRAMVLSRHCQDAWGRIDFGEQDNDEAERAELEAHLRTTPEGYRLADERENEALRKDAERYRWLRDQHEGLMPMEIDADGDLMPRELRALAFTVFYPDPSERESLVPVPIGDLDETIDAAIKENHAD